MREERERRVAERLQGPQCAATVEPDRAERIGFGKALERAAPEAAAPPQRLRIWISVLPGGDEPLRIGLGKPFYLAQPETQRPVPIIVIPAKAGIQGFRVCTVAPCSGQGQALDPRFRGGDG